MDRVLASVQIWKDPSFADMVLFESNVLKKLFIYISLSFFLMTTGFTIGERDADWSSGTGSHS